MFIGRGDLRERFSEKKIIWGPLRVSCMNGFVILKLDFFGTI